MILQVDAKFCDSFHLPKSTSYVVKLLLLINQFVGMNVEVEEDRAERNHCMIITEMKTVGINPGDTTLHLKSNVRILCLSSSITYPIKAFFLLNMIP